MQRSVVALLVEVTVDLAEGVAGRRREDYVPGAGRTHAAPQTFQGVRVVTVNQGLRGDPQVESARVALQLPGASGGVFLPCARPEPYLAAVFPDHDPPRLLIRRKVHAAAAEKVIYHPSAVHSSVEVHEGRAPVGHYQDPNLRPQARAGPCRGPLAHDAVEPHVAPLGQERRVTVVRDNQHRVLLDHPLEAAAGLEHPLHVPIQRADVPPLGGEPLMVGEGVALEEVHQGEGLRLLLEQRGPYPGSVLVVHANLTPQPAAPLPPVQAQIAAVEEVPHVVLPGPTDRGVEQLPHVCHALERLHPHSMPVRTAPDRKVHASALHADLVQPLEDGVRVEVVAVHTPDVVV